MSSAERPPRGCGRARPPCECRCDCGSLLARLVPGGVEVKCRRCKRTQLLTRPAHPAPAAVRRRAQPAAFGEAG